jgi:putative peptidoglycan lipid II flippase
MVTVFGGTAGQLVTQFLLQVVVARQFGAGPEADAYQAAFLWPMSLGMVIAGGLTVAYPPASRRFPEEDRRSRTLLPVVAITALLMATLLVLIGIVQARPLLAHTFPGLPKEQLVHVEGLFRILAWNLPLSVLVGLFQAGLHSRLNFVVPAIGSVVGPGVTLAITALASPQAGIEALAWGTVAGSLVAVVLQGAVLAVGMSAPGVADFRLWAGPVLRLALPSALSLLVMRVDSVVDGYVLASDREGCLALWGYAQRITTPFLMLTSGVLSTIAFPRLSLAATEGHAATAHEFARSLRLSLWLGLPAVAVVGLFSLPLVRDLFQRGEFTAANAATVAETVRWLSGIVVGASIGELCAKTMFALRESRTPLFITVVAIAVMSTLKLVCVRDGDLSRLALINSGISLAVALLYLVLIRRRLGPLVFSGLLAPGGRCLGATVLAVVVGMTVDGTGMPFSGVAGLFAGFGVYAGALWLSGEVRRFREDVK